MSLFKKVFKKVKSNKGVIFGVDGMPFSLAKKYADNGVMPRLREISLPEVSSVAWTSFMTGVNPAKHGIYGFVELKPGTYQYFFPDSHFVKSETVWDTLAEHDKRAVVINLPSTYPAKSMNGVLVSGFVAIDLNKATYPTSYVPELKSFGYRLDVDSEKAQQSMDAFVDDVWKTLEGRERALLHFFDKENWDLFIGVITETDRVHHFLFDAYENEKHPYHGFFLDFYRKIDEIIGKVYDRLEGNQPFFMLSDHGFTVIDKEVYLNRWLREEGYLKVSHDPPRSFEDIADGTLAFALDPGRIYINLRGKYPRGIVEPGDQYEKLRHDLREKLTDFEVDGSPAVKKVFFKEDIYKGPEFELGPDLVVLSNYGFDMKGAINRPSITGKGIFKGMHTQDDALFFINRPIEEGTVNIIDIFPTLLSSMALPRLNSLEGKNLLAP